MHKTTKKVLLVHPGTQYSYKLAEQLYKRNLLYRFCNGILFGSDSFIRKLLNRFWPSSGKVLSNRFIKVPQQILITRPWNECMYLINRNFRESEKQIFRRNRIFQASLSDDLLKKADCIIGFDTSSWIISEKANRLKIPFILDVSIAHSGLKNSIYQSLVEHYPDWPAELEIKSNQLASFEEQELKNAYKIVVASSFSKQSLILNGTDPNKILVNPYGVTLDQFLATPKPVKPQQIRFLFVGLIDARKGIPFLLNVWTRLKRDQGSLTLVGPVTAAFKNYININFSGDSVQLLDKMPHQQMQEIYAMHDVLVFPSFFEGFGLVILEAMASGLPVITTTATGGPDIIEHEVDGWVIEPGNEKQLTDAIQFCLMNPEHITQMGINARKKAESYSWESYGNRWEKIIKEVIENA